MVLQILDESRLVDILGQTVEEPFANIGCSDYCEEQKED